MKSAQRASDTYEEATGNPLEVDKRKSIEKIDRRSTTHSLLLEGRVVQE